MLLIKSIPTAINVRPISFAGGSRSFAATLLALLLLALNFDRANGEIPSQRPFKVAAVQFNPKLGVLRENVDALAKRFEQAARRDAKIIVAPEMATTGYLYIDRQDIADVVETIPGPTTCRFGKIADEYSCYLVWGMPERDAKTGLYYNSAAIVGPDGFVGKYRKTHLWEAEAHWSAWGDLGVPVFDTQFGRVALLICQDANYVETFRLAALSGADIVCFSTNSSGQTIGHLQARAIQNGIYVVSANRSDTEVERYNGKPFEMKGCSAIWSPRGKKLAEAGIKGDEIVCATIDPAAFHMRKVRLSQRSPDTYKALARHVAPWNLRATKRPRTIEAVSLQYLPSPGDLGANRRLVERLLAQRFGCAGKSIPVENDKSGPPADARLIVLPELSLLGRAAAKKTRALAEHLDEGPTHCWAAGLARKYQAFVVCGLAERDGEQLYNSVIVVDPRGERIGHSRKVHLNMEDQKWACAGDCWSLLHAKELGRLGVLIGSDSYLPEAQAVMAIHRADVVAVPAGWHGEIAGDGGIAINDEINPHATRNAMVLWDEMSWGHQFFTVVANSAAAKDRPGGCSGVYSTDPIYGIESTAFAKTDRKEVIVGRFQTLNGAHPQHWIDQHRYIGSRRPDALYHPLLRPLSTRRAPRRTEAPLEVAP